MPCLNEAEALGVGLGIYVRAPRSGGLIAVIGIVPWGCSIRHWSQDALGPMDFASPTRLVIPSATATAIGVELILFSFFLSTLQLSVRDLSPDPTVTEVPQRIERKHANSLRRR
jgi:hypothetical protein